MRSIFQAAVIAALLGLVCTAAAFQDAPTPVRLENGSILYAELLKTVDAKKAKVGDPVTAVLVADVLAHGKIVIRHDSKLVGHVTEVRPHNKEVPESRLGIVFDKVIIKDGEVSFQSLLLAIHPAQRVAFDVPKAPSPASNSAQEINRPYPLPQGSNGGPRGSPTLGDEMKSHDREMTATGPTDIDGLSLSSPANGGAQTIVSTQRTVRLESGVNIELRVIAPGK
ncbi:MAG TPA: hypothetical protein VIK39_10815 [Candidatus Angelobacter sp.]